MWDCSYKSIPPPHPSPKSSSSQKSAYSVGPRDLPQQQNGIAHFRPDSPQNVVYENGTNASGLSSRTSVDKVSLTILGWRPICFNICTTQEWCKVSNIKAQETIRVFCHKPLSNSNAAWLRKPQWTSLASFWCNPMASLMIIRMHLGSFLFKISHTCERAIKEKSDVLFSQLIYSTLYFLYHGHCHLMIMKSQSVTIVTLNMNLRLIFQAGWSRISFSAPTLPQ